MRRRSHSALPVCLLVAASCSQCERKQEGARAPLTRYMPANVEAAIVLPDLRVVTERLRILTGLKIATFLAGTQGFGTADELVQSLVMQLGVDLRSPEAMARAGVDPARGAAVAFLPGDQAFLVFAVHDASMLSNTLTALAKTRLGAGVAATRTEAGVTLTLFSRTASGPPELAVALRDGVALVGAGAAAARVATFAALSADASLEKDAALGAGLSRLPAPRDFFVYAPASSSWLRMRHLPALTVVGTLTPDALSLRADMPWPNTRSSLAALDLKPGPDLLGLLPAEAFAVARFQGDPSALAPFWPLLVGPSVAEAARAAGFDVKSEVLDNLLPGAVLALAVAPTAKLGTGMPELDVRRTNPFAFVHLVAAAKAKDASKAEATLERVPAVAQRFGAHVTPSERGGKKVFLTTYAQGEGTDFALMGDTWVMAAPVTQLDATLARAAKGGGAGPAAGPALREALKRTAISAVLDLHQLSESVRALPSEAWGIGGFAIKATTVRWLDATDDLRAVTLGVSEKGGAVQGELTLRLGAK
jgi:hypothetical protein